MDMVVPYASTIQLWLEWCLLGLVPTTATPPTLWLVGDDFIQLYQYEFIQMLKCIIVPTLFRE